MPLTSTTPSRLFARTALLALASVWLLLSTSACTTWARRLSDDHRDGNISVWVHSPHIAAGDTLHLEVGAYDDPRVGIETVRVFVNGQLITSGSGVGNNWGSSIRTSDKSILWEDSDFVWLRIPVPSDAKGKLAIEVEVHYVSASRLGKSFSNSQRSKRLRFDVPVLSPGMRTFRRGLSGASAAMALLLLWFLFRRVGARILGWLNNDRDPTAPLLIVAIVWIGVGYWWFAARVAIATGAYGFAVRLISTLVWLAALIAVAWLHDRRRPPAG